MIVKFLAPHATSQLLDSHSLNKLFRCTSSLEPDVSTLLLFSRERDKVLHNKSSSIIPWQWFSYEQINRGEETFLSCGLFLKSSTWRRRRRKSPSIKDWLLHRLHKTAVFTLSTRRWVAFEAKFKHRRRKCLGMLHGFRASSGARLNMRNGVVRWLTFQERNCRINSNFIVMTNAPPAVTTSPELWWNASKFDGFISLERFQEKTNISST